MYLQFCSFELELSILQQGVVFLLTVFELMLFEFVWCYFLWRYLKIHGMEIESYCKIKRFLKRLQIALQIRILYFSTHHNTNKDMKYIQYEIQRDAFSTRILYITYLNLLAFIIYKRFITFWQVSSGKEVYINFFQVQYRLDFTKNSIAGMKTEKQM